ncbi:energy transducer TonB [Lacisediminimonas sp.]|nr:energy transducer TonB [Lacisediminimonas sp.]MDO8298480.1 energy transducer TonB [Lacisediminimonas sp.]
MRTGSGFELLDRAAVMAVSRWKFVPARQGADPVGAWVLVPVNFKLKA